MRIKVSPNNETVPKLYIELVNQQLNVNQQVFHIKNNRIKQPELNVSFSPKNSKLNVANSMSQQSKPEICFNKWLYQKVEDFNSKYATAKENDPNRPIALVLPEEKKSTEILDRYTSPFRKSVNPAGESIPDTQISVINSVNVQITKRSPSLDLRSLIETLSLFTKQPKNTAIVDLGSSNTIQLSEEELDVTDKSNVDGSNSSSESITIDTDNEALPSKHLTDATDHDEGIGENSLSLEKNEHEVTIQKNVEILKKSPFEELFQGLPPNYPILQIFLNGICIHVSRFIKIDKEIVHLIDESEQMISIDCWKIDGVSWGTLDNE